MSQSLDSSARTSLESGTGTARSLPLDGGALPKGARIGKCEIVAMLGQGGMGAVYQARHISLDIDVALKVITFAPASESERKEGVLRFVREARAAAKVRHENVIQILDVDSEGGMHYMLMELVDGVSARKLCEAGALPLPEAVRIVREAARALAAAHRSSIVHRDVKPENILLTRDGRVKVSDFGIAHVAGGFDAKLTRTGQIIGTPHYMAPEQVDGLALDGRADIYALGASLFHLVTGTTPFTGPTALQVCMKHLSAPIPSARERNAAVPPEVDAVIAKAMAKDPGARFATADEFADALEPFAGPRRPLSEQALAAATGAVTVGETPSGGALVTPAGGGADPSGATVQSGVGGGPPPGAAYATPGAMTGMATSGAHAAVPASTPAVLSHTTTGSIAGPTPVASAAPAASSVAAPLAPAASPPVPAAVSALASAPAPAPAPPPRGGGAGLLVAAAVVVAIGVAAVFVWKGSGSAGKGPDSAGTSPGASTASSTGRASSGASATASTSSTAGAAPREPVADAPPRTPPAADPKAWSPERQQAIMRAAQTSASAYELLSQGRFDSALPTFDAIADDAIRYDDGNMKAMAASGLYAASVALEQAGRKKEALARVERILEQFPDCDRTIRKTAVTMASRLRTTAQADDAKIPLTKVLELEGPAKRVCAGDVDGDGRPDLIVCSSWGAFFTSRGQPMGSLSARRPWPVEGPGAATAEAVAVHAAYAPSREAAESEALAWVTAPFQKGAPRRSMLAWTLAGPGDARPRTLPLGDARKEHKDPVEFLPANIDGDGHTDLIGFGDGARSVHVFKGGAEGFAAPESFLLPGDVEVLCAADVTGDKRDDLVVLVDTVSKREPAIRLLVYTFSADGKAELLEWGLQMKASWPRLAVGDLTGDGIADIAVTTPPKEGERSLSFYRAKGNGFFEQIGRPLELGFIPDGGLITDIDADGKGDLLVYARNTPDGVLHAFLSKGDGSFVGTAQNLTFGMGDVREITACDFDQDGKVDLALHEYAKAIGIVYGDGKGRFSSRQEE